MKRAVACGLQRWAPRRFVKHVCGKPIISGALAAAKPDSCDTRMISAAVPANECLDMAKVPRSPFPQITQLGVLAAPGRGRRLLISKRDVRHFYHMLRATSGCWRIRRHWTGDH